jgi:hypothetical protein
MKLILYHGTSRRNALKIEREGFLTDKKYNWRVKSKKGFIYLSIAYAPFYAFSIKNANDTLALIKVEVDTNDLYPEDDFLMLMMGKPVYKQRDINKVDFEKYKYLWKASLEYLGNVAIKPEKIRIIGITYFDGKRLILKCDPCITTLNFKIMGNYYAKLTEWIYKGKNIMEFPNFMEMKA